MERAARVLAVLVAVWLLAGGSRASATALASAASAAAQEQEHVEPLTPENAQEVSRQTVHGEPLWMGVARIVNFAILVGVLVYFLRAPIAQYLAHRATQIRSDLVKAAQTRAEAAARLAAIEQKMRALPEELEALRRRGAEEIAAEEARIREAAAAERARALGQARREIELQLRAAERDLIKHAADLTVGLAADRIKRTISDEDRARLVDQYLARIAAKQA